MKTLLALLLAPALFAQPTVSDAGKLLDDAEEEHLVLSTEAGRAS